MITAGFHRSKRAVLKLVAHSLTPVKQKKKVEQGKKGGFTGWYPGSLMNTGNLSFNRKPKKQKQKQNHPTSPSNFANEPDLETTTWEPKAYDKGLIHY